MIDEHANVDVDAAAWGSRLGLHFHLSVVVVDLSMDFLRTPISMIGPSISNDLRQTVQGACWAVADRQQPRGPPWHELSLSLRHRIRNDGYVSPKSARHVRNYNRHV